MIIHRSIFKELFINFMVVVLSMSVLLFMERFVRLSGLIIGKGAELTDVIKVFLYLQPSLLLLSIPMAMLTAIFLTYGRMSSDNEIVVLKNSGMSFWGISKAAFVLSLLSFFVLFFISLYLSPRGMQFFKATLYETIARKASTVFEEESFLKVFKETVIYVKDIPSKNRFKGIFVYRETDTPASSTKSPLVIVAEEGAIISNPEEGLIKLTLHNGMIHTFSKEDASEISFSEYDFVLTLGIEPAKSLKPNEMGTFELWEGRRDNVLWDVELQRRFALPFACLIFGILGPALSTKMGKIGRLGGFSFSLSVFILYYALLIIGEGLAKAGKIPPLWGGWIPNISFGALAALFFFRAYRDMPIKKL